MCFSAGASFGASAVLSIIGIAAIKKTHTTAQIMFAGIPLVFAVQQAAEGFVWLALLNPVYAMWLNPATYVFLAFAQVVWPTWVPLSLLLLEKEAKRRKWLTLACASGLLVSFYLTYRLFTQPIHADIVGMHISYTLGAYNSALNYSAILYFIVTVGSPFLSGVAKMWIFGWSIAIAYLVTILFFKEYELSVWCFFAAITSVIVFSILFELKRNWMIQTRHLVIRQL